MFTFIVPRTAHITSYIRDDAAKDKGMRPEEDDQQQLAGIRTYSGGK